METVELRPLSLGELLDRTFSLYRHHFWLFVGIMAVPSAFTIPMNFLILSFEGSMFSSARVPTAPSPFLLAGFGIGYLLFFGIFMLVYAVAAAAATHAVAQAYLGRSSSVSEAYSKIRGKFWRLMGVAFSIMIRLFGIMLLTVVLAALGGGVIGAVTAATGASIGGRVFVALAALLGVLVYICGLAFGVYFALRYAVSISVLMLENLGVLATIRRSIALTRGRRGHIFVALLLAGIISTIGVFVFQLPFSIMTMISMTRGTLSNWLAFGSAVAGAVGGSITGPVYMIVLVLCYYDTRIRKEAFDLQFMMSSLDRPAPAAGTISPA